VNSTSSVNGLSSERGHNRRCARSRRIQGGRAKGNFKAASAITGWAPGWTTPTKPSRLCCDPETPAANRRGSLTVIDLALA